jgi:hypothetical protein
LQHLLTWTNFSEQKPSNQSSSIRYLWSKQICFGTRLIKYVLIVSPNSLYCSVFHWLLTCTNFSEQKPSKQFSSIRYLWSKQICFWTSFEHVLIVSTNSLYCSVFHWLLTCTNFSVQILSKQFNYISMVKANMFLEKFEHILIISTNSLYCCVFHWPLTCTNFSEQKPSIQSSSIIYLWSSLSSSTY